MIFIPVKNMKKNLLIIIVTLLVSPASAQTLFTYGKHSVDAKEFLRAYQKNNTGPVANKAKAMRDYLDLYINSRLKIQEAYELRYDTLPTMKMELANLRTQITENYMTDPDLTARMTKEAFQRSLKDIRVSHIYISNRNSVNGAIDTLAAQKKTNEILERLKKGEDFAQVARQLSDDTTSRENGGDMGFITVFTLPYDFENAIYNTAPGKHSAVVRSKSGYHIFKRTAERKALGKIRLQQILLAIPNWSDEAEKKQIAARADSLYKRLLAGDNFNRLALDFSNDYVTSVSGGLMPDVSVGQFDPAFEKMIWSITKDGGISKPFLTSHGWHIIKRISVRPVVTDPNSKINQQELQQKIVMDGRWKNSRDFIYKKVAEKKTVRRLPYDDAALWNMTDSVLDKKPMTSGWAIKATTPLFAIGDSVYDANDWINYAYTHRFKQDGTGLKPLDQLRDEWVNYNMIEYFKANLEEFAEEFRYQMKEFAEGNLFFEIMQQEIWNRSQTDTTGLMALYEKNKKNYLWKQSVDAVLFFCSDLNTATAAHAKMKSTPSDWRKISELFTEKLVADSSRYEWNQVPNLGKSVPKAGTLTNPLLNTTDNTASFAYVFRVYPQPTQRTFTEARGLVINDYQVILEKEWEASLKKKYPVTIDEKVFAEISK
jgi:peptidyl-prolyl cis-trans isomerase SurA